MYLLINNITAERIRSYKYDYLWITSQKYARKKCDIKKIIIINKIEIKTKINNTY
jgi:hypothetical protein